VQPAGLAPSSTGIHSFVEVTEIKSYFQEPLASTRRCFRKSEDVMPTREQAIDREVRELWCALRTDPPPCTPMGSEMLHVLIGGAGHLSYDRLISPHLRPSQISRPPSRS
jgi:hypothetical protein